MTGSPRQIIESKEYTEQIAALGGAKTLDAALDALLWAVCTKPEDFPVVPGLRFTRIATTDPVPWLNLPTLVMYFQIKDEQRVELRWIEKQDEEYA